MIQNIIKISVDAVILNEMNITDDEIKEVINQIILLKPQIKNLALQSNLITDKGAEILTQALSDNLSSLKFIDLQFNNIDVKGAKALMELKSKREKLKIALHGNEIADQGVMYDIEQLAKRTVKTQN